MTEITLERDDSMVEVNSLAVKVIGACLMALGVFLTVSLLTWAINFKLDNTNVGEPSSVTAEFRERQLGCLAKNIYYEAGYEPFEGKVAVAQVTLNRVESGKFPGDVCRTIYQKNIFYEKVVCQFSWACDRTALARPVNKVVYAESMEVAKKVLLENFRLPSLKDALYFHGDYINPGWNREKITQIGRHIFYK
jgi:spore germination cell wall hydrolase CwlJ-like protein